MAQKYELTFLVCELPEGKKVLIEGMFPEPQELNAIMLQGMAEMYTPKFVTFLERKDLISLTLKAAMTWTEFNNFIDLVGEPTFADTLERSDKERFIQALKERGILNISYIFNEELLAGDRDIPWRSRVALSRLRKDFKMIPMYQDLDQEGMKRVRRQIIQDVVRPMQTEDVIYPIVANSDLAETEEFKESEIDREMIACLSDELLLRISRTFLKEATGQREADFRPEKTTRLAKQIASSLNSKEINGRDRILEAYYKHELIPIDELPEATQRRLKKKREIDKFLRKTDFYLKKFDEIQDEQIYLRFARSLKNILPELIHKDQYEEIEKITAVINRHSNEKETLSEHARQILNEIEKGKILEALKAKFMTGQKEICSAIAPIFVALGKRSVPHLLPLLEESDDQVVHRTACEILLDIDPSSINLILGELNREDFGTTSAVRMIRVLGDMGDDQGTEQLSDRLKGFLKHENPRVRREALGAWYKLVEEKGEGVYMALLNDPDVGMQKEAIQCLGKIKSKAALEKFLAILDALKDAPSDKKQQIAPTLFSALAFYGNVDGPRGGSLEDFLLETLQRQVSLGPLKFIKKKKSVLSEGAVASICEALGKIGTIKSRPILQKLEKQDNLVWKNKAREALRTIIERVNVSQH